jgi:hypothetical protein
VAREIEARMHSSTGVVSSFAKDDAEKLDQVRCWSRADDGSEVARFITRLVTSLEESYQRHLAMEEAERARYGT